MSYNINKMPKTMEEWQILVSYYYNEDQTRYQAEKTAAEAAARTQWEAMPEDNEKPALAEFLAMAQSTVTPPKTLAEIEQTFACYHPDKNPALAQPCQTPEEERQLRLAEIDAETSTAILNGFDYEINGQTYHFKYDSFDQQNFADLANTCILAKSGSTIASASVGVDAWQGETKLRLTLTATDFLNLYLLGALAHKENCRAIGREKKAALA